MKSRGMPSHPLVAVRRATRRRALLEPAAQNDESGFTLIELVVVIAILPIIVGAMTAGLLSVISFQPVISNRLSDSGDAQVLSTKFDKDVQGAQMITTSATASPCLNGTLGTVGTLGTQILGLQYGDGTQVSYVLFTQGSGAAAVQSLFRNVCHNTLLSSSVIVSHNVVNASGSGSPAATIICANDTPTPASCAGSPPAYTAGWVSVARVDSVTLPILYAASDYKQNLVAVPSGGVNAGGGSSLNLPAYSCGFATQSTGTLASSLCFMDFTAWNTHTGTPCAGGGLEISEGITNTPFTMSFCLSVTGTPVAGASIPTYTNPPTSEAFLGNNGFYTGIPGNPALYQTGSGTSTISISNIQVLGSGNVPATNWELITGDAESTDSGESLQWTAGWSPGTTVPLSAQVFSLIDDSPTLAIGNDCANPTPGSGLTPGNGLTGVGNNSVTCASSVDSDKTGIPIISAPAPSSLTAVMVGTGLQAIFVGLLLPSSS